MVLDRRALRTGASFFDGVAQEDVHLPGLDGRVPTFFRDTASVRASFTASTRKVAALLPDARLHPLELWPGRCLVTFVALEHRDSDIGPFNELAIALVVAVGRRPLPLVGALARTARLVFDGYLLHLAVSTEIARIAASRLGLVARVAEVGFTDDGRWRTCVVDADGTHLLTLRARRVDRRRTRRMDVRLQSMLDGKLHRVLLETNQHRLGLSFRPGSVALQLGAHPVSARASSLFASPTGEMIVYRPTPAEAPQSPRR